MDALARWVKGLPAGIKLPLIFMEVVLLVGLFSWLYFTRSVETVETPDVAGRPIEQARDILTKYGLNLRVIERNSTRTDEGVVIRQIPRAGTLIKENRRVELYVSIGPELVEVPDLTGETLFSARNQLQRMQGEGDGSSGPLLNLGSISRVYHNATKKDRIILQDPPPGRTVIRGTQVNLLVSRGAWPRRTVVPDVSGEKMPETKSILRKNHLEVGNVRYTLNEQKPPSVVLDQNPSSGRLVRRDRPISLTVNLSREARVADRRYTMVRVTPPLSMEPGDLRVELIDRRGERVVFNEAVDPGEQVQFMVSIRGGAKLIIYWNDEIYRFRRLEYER
jgi:serine/threonine-protein kinase